VHQRAELVRAFISNDINTLLESLDSDDEKEVAAGLSYLVHLRQINAKKILKFLESPSAAIKRRAALGLSDLKPDKSVISKMIEALEDGDPIFVSYLLYAMGELKFKEFAKPIEQTILNHPDERVREFGVGALGAIGDKESLNTIIICLKDHKARVRRRAILALASYKGPEVEKAIESAKSDRDYQVRQNATFLS
jgi:HEAT repeat protein